MVQEPWVIAVALPCHGMLRALFVNRREFYFIKSTPQA
jgi:hypothetical protein